MIKKRYFIIIALFTLTGLFSCTLNKKVAGDLNKLKNNYKDGLWIELINEKDIQVAKFKLGKKEGTVITIYSNGEKAEFKYQHDKKNGKAYFYRKDGVLYLEQIYKDDVLISEIKHSPIW